MAEDNNVEDNNTDIHISHDNSEVIKALYDRLSQSS